jgi:large subunit ribosomal protein L21
LDEEVVVSQIYAIVETGGKQYRVAPGDVIRVEKIEGEPGTPVTLDRVLFATKEDTMAIGTPTIPGAKVIASLIGNDRADKIIVFKYKSKVRYRRKLGHRQPFSELQITDIVVP